MTDLIVGDITNPLPIIMKTFPVHVMVHQIVFSFMKLTFLLYETDDFSSGETRMLIWRRLMYESLVADP